MHNRNIIRTAADHAELEAVTIFTGKSIGACAHRTQLVRRRLEMCRDQVDLRVSAFGTL